MNSEKLDLDSDIAKLVVENANRFRRKTARREYVDISRKLFESKIGKYSGYLDWGGEDYPQAYFVWLNFPETLKVDTGDWKYDGMDTCALGVLLRAPGFVAGGITRGFTARYCYPPRRLCGHLTQCL